MELAIPFLSVHIRLCNSSIPSHRSTHLQAGRAPVKQIGVIPTSWLFVDPRPPLHSTRTMRHVAWQHKQESRHRSSPSSALIASGWTKHTPHPHESPSLFPLVVALYFVKHKTHIQLTSAHSCPSLFCTSISRSNTLNRYTVGLGLVRILVVHTPSRPLSLYRRPLLVHPSHPPPPQSDVCTHCRDELRIAVLIASLLLLLLLSPLILTLPSSL